ncbi:hypothetical protein [Nitratireductor soli]|uniref:hypothetical protein n=1 Tax=Nitratireductor soli TaxID=1670619 RepID=UPI0019D24C6E|nr:hypothetical protein [Nitratireductor soli]
MNPYGTETEQMRNVLAIGVWENEGGASGRDCLDEPYGRRIEAERSWIAHRVFSGVPADGGGQSTTGLGRLDATGGMLSTGSRDDGHYQDRGSLTQGAGIARYRIEDCLS